MISKLKFIINESFRGFFYARTPILLSSMTIGISLIVISISFYGYLLFMTYSGSFNNEYKIEVFFEDKIDKGDSEKLYNSILEFEGIIGGEFIDKDKSAKIFSSYFSQDIEDLFGSNILPFSGQFFIDKNYRNIDSLTILTNRINLLGGIDTVHYDKQILYRTYVMINNVMTGFSLIGFCIVIISIILVSNTTRLMIHSKKDNIKIFSLLGATNLFIKLPFLLEGIIQGIFGACISVFILFIIKSIVEYILNPFVLYYDANIQFILILNFVLGGVLGFFGSKRAISKYLL